MGLLSRIGLVSRKELDALKGDVVILETRLRMAKARAAEKRSSGVLFNWGEFEYEKNEALRGSARWDIYDAMEADPEVKASLMQATLPLVNATWEFKAASDKARDKEIADLCTANLLCGETDRFGSEYWLSTGWKGQRLLEILDFLKSGFSMFAKSWKVVDSPTGGMKRVYDRLQWLEPYTVDPRGWEIDDADNIVAIRRTLRTPEGQFKLMEPIDAEDLALYVHDLKGARYEGRPFIRSMYGAWLRKDFVLRQSAIHAQKVGSPMPVGFYPSGYETPNIARFTEAVESARGTSPADAYFVGPKGTEGDEPVIKYVGSEMEVDRMRSLIDGENKEIAKAGFRGSMQLGQSDSASGSRAVAGDQSSTEMTIIEALAGVLISQEQHGVANLEGVVDHLVDQNYAGVRTKPQLCVKKIRPDEDLNLETRILDAWGKGVLPKIPEVRKAIAEGLGFSLPEEAYVVESPIPGAVDPVTGQPVPPDPNAPDTGNPGERKPPNGGTKLPTGGTKTAPGAKKPAKGETVAAADSGEEPFPGPVTDKGQSRRRYREAIPEKTWSEAPVSSELLDGLIGTQATVSTEKLAGFIGSPSAITSEPIHVLKVGETRYISDGHHRAAAALRLGMKRLPAKVVLVDQEPKNLSIAGDGLGDEIARIKSLPQGSTVVPHDGGGGAKPRGWFRAPTAFEDRFVNLGVMDRELTRFEQRYYAAAASVLNRTKADVVDRMRSGRINEKNYATLFAGTDGPNLKYRASLRSAIEGVLRKIARFGAVQVQDELDKQRAHPSTQNTQNSTPATAIAGALPQGARTVTVTSDLLDTRATIDVGTLAGRLEADIIREAETLYRQGLSDSEVATEMETFLGNLSDKPIGELARKATASAFNLGRNIEIQRQKESIAFVLRTEILDGATCPSCYGLDGNKYDVGSDEYFEFMPPNKCDGGDRCRGFFLAIFDPGTELEERGLHYDPDQPRVPSGPNAGEWTNPFGGTTIPLNRAGIRGPSAPSHPEGKDSCPSCGFFEGNSNRPSCATCQGTGYVNRRIERRKAPEWPKGA